MQTNDTFILLKESLRLTNQIFKPNYSFIKAGVIMQKLKNNNYQQNKLMKILELEKQAKREKLIKIIDGINRIYGRNTISWAVCGLDKSWQLRQEEISRYSTTIISKIPIVHA